MCTYVVEDVANQISQEEGMDGVLSVCLLAYGVVKQRQFGNPKPSPKQCNKNGIVLLSCVIYSLLCKSEQGGC